MYITFEVKDLKTAEEIALKTRFMAKNYLEKFQFGDYSDKEKLSLSDALWEAALSMQDYIDRQKAKEAEKGE